eukprot:CAMPEP_0198134924 /NCGR_PEP_ID=MMETSP1442-20131203/60321_1 /TAXON_ID= /ORGANISM="Craspedostauros australis, Strain CCMP3328" /LENGTH=401 /DNA_ID=CAMNT_0043796081 /DNA_START=349 /DNA_END=1553 /DNA_ORIENTATION=-
MSTQAEKIAAAIPAKFVMFSGSEDAQTSADVSNVNTFELPDPAGKAGGACTSTLLSVLNNLNGQPVTWIELLRRMRQVLKQKGFDQVPQLASSRLLDVNHQFEIVPEETRRNGGAKRAILIGINYVGQKGQLSGCHNDVLNIKDYLINKEGFAEKDMLILMDDNKNHNPTRKNIEDAFRRITQYSRANDCVFIHYSGHGGNVPDQDGDEEDGYDETLIPVVRSTAEQMTVSSFTTPAMVAMSPTRMVSNSHASVREMQRHGMICCHVGEFSACAHLHSTLVNLTSSHTYLLTTPAFHFTGDEEDGYDETLIPVDFKSAGQIIDDDILKMLVMPMPAGVNVTVLMDCCHSGTVLDLPYSINATETQMHSNSQFNMGMLDDVQTICCVGCLYLLFADMFSEFL